MWVCRGRPQCTQKDENGREHEFDHQFGHQCVIDVLLMVKRIYIDGQTPFPTSELVEDASVPSARKTPHR